MNIPSWSLANGDDVICLAELKLGFIAQVGQLVHFKMYRSRVILFCNLALNKSKILVSLDVHLRTFCSKIIKIFQIIVLSMYRYGYYRIEPPYAECYCTVHMCLQYYTPCILISH
jgi:hypothetical protein